MFLDPLSLTQTNRSHRNEAAIQHAETLAKMHNVKTVAYKVNGNLPPPPLECQLPRANMCSKVSNSDQVQAGIAEVLKEFGRIDVFVANAGKNALISERTGGEAKNIRNGHITTDSRTNA